MAALGPGFGKSNGDSPAPTTPRGRASKEINSIIESIANEFGLPLKPRVGTFSPSKRPDGYAERCVDHINFLFFRNYIVLQDVIVQFRKDKAEDAISADHLEEFYSRLRTAAYLEKHNPYPRKPLLLDVLRQDSESRKTAPKLSLTQTKLIPTIKKRSEPNQVKVKDTESQSPKDQSLPAFLDPAPAPRGAKRLSAQESCSSSKYVRPIKQRRWQPSLEDQFSYKVSPLNLSPLTSHLSSPVSMNSEQVNQSFDTTIATSFKDAYDDSDSSSVDYGPEPDPSQAERLMANVEQFAFKDSGVFIEPLGECHPTDNGLLQYPYITSADTNTIAAKIQVQSENRTPAKESNSTCKSASSTMLEHRLVRSLPTDGLFGSPTAVSVNHSSFHLVWESYRLADATGRHFRYYADENELGRNVPAGTPFQRKPGSVWKAIADSTRSANVILKANLSFNMSVSADKLFTLSLQPFKYETACVFQRRFGSSRFLYIELPRIDTLNIVHLNGQQVLLNSRFLEWMLKDKVFLGRTWRVFHIQDVKKKNNKSGLPSQRLVLFAVDGPGLQKISLDELIEWAIPATKNGDQGFPKAYARLDLFLSQTTPTVKFTPREVKYVKDTFADGAPESEEFNDRSLKFEYSSSPSGGKAVMNDGCSLISVGAAKQMCKILGITGVRPVAFQGRINGCKGVWVISAPYDTAEPKHQERWIHMTESQCKVMPRDEDFTNNCEPDRWSFELVKFTSPPKPSNLHLDFIPILHNRHVSRDTLQEVIESQLEMDFSAFLTSLDDPTSLRRWLHSEFSGMEKLNRTLGIKEAGNFPSDWVEKSILLLESGFNPLTNQHLAMCIQQVVNLWLSSMRAKLKIRLGRSAMVMGVADPTGCLKPGEIHMAFSETFRDETSGEVWSHLKGPVLVARHPAMRGSDMQKVRAVFREELSHLNDVVVFPSTGCVPLAHKLQGGDYDGDTFWLCWDTRLTAGFKNAPAPHNEPRLDYYGIKKDTRKLKEVLGSDSNVDTLLLECFKLKLQEDLLGKVTKLHGKLAYKENSISSKNVGDLVGLHDLVIDSAKNGYILTQSAFSDFVRKKLGIRGVLHKPAYQSWMDPTTDSTIGHLQPNLEHIIDYLLFKIVNPRMEQLAKNCQQKLAAAESYDEDLIKPYQDRQASIDPVIVDVLKRMTAELAKVNFIGSSAEKLTKEMYTLQAARALEAAIQPIHTEDRAIQEWLWRATPNSFNTWELIKASAFYLAKHQFKSTLVFLVAGKELCHIKAMARQGSRVVVGQLWETYKPKKEKKVVHKRQASLPVTESSESSEAEFLGAIE